MFSQLISVCIAGISMQGQVTTPAKANTADPVKLERKYKADELDRYEMSADLVLNGMNGKATATMSMKTLKELKEGLADVEMVAEQFSMLLDGNDTGTGAPDKVTARFNKNGMPDDMDVQNERFIYAILAVSAYVPGETELNKDFDIKWSTKSDSIAIKGRGKVIELVQDGDTKVAVIKSTISVTPKGDDAGDIELKSRIDQATGKLLGSEGTVKIGDGTEVKYKIKRIKAKA